MATSRERKKKKGKASRLGLNVTFCEFSFISNNETLGNTKFGQGKIIQMF